MIAEDYTLVGDSSTGNGNCVAGSTYASLTDACPSTGDQTGIDMVPGDVILWKGGLIFDLDIGNGGAEQVRHIQVRIGSVALTSLQLGLLGVTPAQFELKTKCISAGASGKVQTTGYIIFDGTLGFNFPPTVATVNTVGVMDLFDIFAKSTDSKGLITLTDLAILYP